MDVSKYPVNERGYTVIPCIALTPENMSNDLVGFQVTIGLKEAGQGTSTGTIKGYTDDHLKIEVGSKIKKLPYDPEDIELCVYQFSKRILFSNETVILKKPQEPQEETSPATKGVAAPKAKKTPQKADKPPVKQGRKPQEKKASKKGYVPKHGITFG